MPKTEKMKAKIALVGDSGVGKTSLIRRFVLDEFDDRYIHTIGTKVSKISLTVPRGPDLEIDVDVSIFDIIGQKGFRDMIRESFFHDLQGLLAVCEVTNRGSLNDLADWIATALEISGNVPVYILVNKNDLASHAAFKEEDVDRAARSWDSLFVFTSAKTGEGVDDAFNALVVDIVENAFRTVRNHAASDDLQNRVLEGIAPRGTLGMTKSELFVRFRGVGYDDLKSAIDRLEARGLVRVDWSGPAEFLVVITSQGEAFRRGAVQGVSAVSSIR